MRPLIRRLLPPLLLAMLAVGPLCAYALLDTRAPNDHDGLRTDGAIAPLLRLERVSSWGEKLGEIGRYAAFGAPEQTRPPLAQTALLVVLALFGPSYVAYRLANLPFVLLLVLGVWRAGSTLGSRRFGWLVAAVTATTPALLIYSRKWNIKVHGAALLMLAVALALALICQREVRRRVWPWIGLGALLGLCLYTHQATYFGVAGLALALTVTSAALAWQRRRPSAGSVAPATPNLQLGPRALLGRLALCGAAALVVGSWALGLFAPLGASPTYALPVYLAQSAFKVGAGAADPFHEPYASLWTGLRCLAISLASVHWMPPLALLLGLPGLLATPAGLLLRPRCPDDRRLRRGLRFLALMLAIQAPFLLITLKNRVTPANWIAMLGPTVLLLLGSLWRVHDAWWERRSASRGSGESRRVVPFLYGGLLLVLGVATAALPTLLGVWWADPLSEPAKYRAGALRLLTRLDTRAGAGAPLVPSLGPKLHRQLMRAVRATLSDEPTGRPRVVLNAWNITVPPTAERGTCRWNLRPSGPVQGKDIGRWPAIFAGLRCLCFNPQPAVETSRFHLVRLNLEPAPRDAAVEWSPTVARHTRPACLEEARLTAAGILQVPPSAATIWPDPEPWLGSEHLRQPPLTYADVFAPYRRQHMPQTYLQYAVVVDRGVGPVSAPECRCLGIDDDARDSGYADPQPQENIDPRQLPHHRHHGAGRPPPPDEAAP